MYSTLQSHWAAFSQTFACVDQLQLRVAGLRDSLVTVQRALHAQVCRTRFSQQPMHPLTWAWLGARPQETGGPQANAVQLALKHERLKTRLANYGRLVALLQRLAQVEHTRHMTVLLCTVALC